MIGSVRGLILEEGSFLDYRKSHFIVPKAHKKTIFDVNNLQFLTWFENRCKNDISWQDWQLMKQNIQLYFI